MFNGSKVLPKTPILKFDFLVILPKSIDPKEIIELSNSDSNSPYNVDLFDWKVNTTSKKQKKDENNLLKSYDSTQKFQIWMGNKNWRFNEMVGLSTCEVYGLFLNSKQRKDFCLQVDNLVECTRVLGL